MDPKHQQLCDTMRPILMRQRRELLKTVRADLDRFASTHPHEVGDAADGAVENEYREISSRLSRVEARELELITDALKRIDDGVYGRCEQCEREIPLPRLEALPYATTCIDCQQRADWHQGARRAAPIGGRSPSDPEMSSRN